MTKSKPTTGYAIIVKHPRSGWQVNESCVTGHRSTCLQRYLSVPPGYMTDQMRKSREGLVRQRESERNKTWRVARVEIKELKPKKR